MKKSKAVVTNQANKQADTQALSTDHAFPIVGIGASAGGLEAIEQFLTNASADCNMAFVVVQHLDPTHKDIMCELLQRVTHLKVKQITDRTVVKPNHVYVIPPNHDLSILNGMLLLFARVEHQGLHLPIDYFFRALAADKKDQSIGVILSGMGSDGTLGLRMIKDHAGAVFVQSPDSAKFDGMPSSAINAGLADVVAPAEELIGKIVNYVNHVPLQLGKNIQQNSIEKVLAVLRSHTGHDFSYYKKTTIYRRIGRRMALHQLTNIDDYVNYLRSNPQESDILFKELLIGVTSFFRDAKVWEQLKTELIYSLLSRYPEGGTLRAWVPACSTGEEAYTLAIVFKEALKQFNSPKHFTLQIFATDLDNEAVSKARTAVYPYNISDYVSSILLDRYFVKIEQGYQVDTVVRDMVIFSQQNLVMDPPFTKLDIISCRNLLIYLAPDLQKKLIPLFHYSLNPSGLLVLGLSETIGNNATLFTPLKGKQRIFQRCDTVQPINIMAFPTHAEAGDLERRKKSVPVKPQAEQALNFAALTHSLLKEHFTPAALLTTEKADIIYIHGKTGQYLEPAVGKVNYNLFAMARQGLAEPLNEVFYRAVRLKKTLALKSIKVGTNGGAVLVDVSVKPLLHPAALLGMVFVLFTVSTSQTAPKKTRSKKNQANEYTDEVETLKQGLEEARKELQITTNEMQLSEEKLQTTNEELQSVNEELQSTNEELTTSKEEMQSMNEELQTVNNELNAKVSELSEANDDMKNLLNSTNIATLFLDHNLKIRRFTTETLKLFKLIPSDIGRPITDLVNLLIYPALATDVQEVMRSLIYHQEEVATHDGRWYVVRIIPYRTQDNRIDGVVITFSDNTASRKANIAMTKSESRFRLLFENLSNAVAYKSIIMKGDKAVDFNYLEVNNAYTTIVGVHKVKGKKGSELVPNILQSNAEFMAVCGRVAMTGKSEKIEYYVKKTKQWFVCSMYSQAQGLLVCVTENITDKKQAVKALTDINMTLAQVEKASKTELKKALINMQNLLGKLLNIER